MAINAGPAANYRLLGRNPIGPGVNPSGQSYAGGSADRPHGMDANPWDPLYQEQAGYTSNIAPFDFMTLVQMALEQSGVNANALGVDQIYQIAQLAWQDPLIQQTYSEYGGQGYTSVIDFTASQPLLFQTVKDEIFNPAKSSNAQLLAKGVGLIQQQGKPLTSEQSSYVSAGTTAVPKVFQGTYPISLDFGQGGPGGDEDGIDYAMPVGQTITAPFGGTVQIDSSGKSNWGLRVLIKLSNGWTFAVGHLTATGLQNGQQIDPGTIIGYSGGDVSDPNSGISTGPHIEVQWMNPQGQFTNPHAIMDPILAGTTFQQLGEAQGMTGGPSGRVVQPAFPGDDPNLDAQYSGVVGVWKQYFATPPTGAQILSAVQGLAAGTVPAGQATVTQLAEQVGFTAAQAAIVAAISMAESGGDPGRDQYPGQNYGGIGLMQIEYEAHPDLLKKYGGVQGLHDPLNNLKAAFEIFQAAGNSFSPWTTFTGGAYQQFLGQDPQVRTGGGTTGPVDLAAVQNRVRGLPSHIPGMNQGQYYDLQQSANSVMQKYFGHAAPDSIIAELHGQGATNPAEIDRILGDMSENVANQMSSATYNQMYQANQGAMSGIYNQPGTADPRTIMAQHQQMQQQEAPAEQPLPPIWQRQEALEGNQPPPNGSTGGGGGGYYTA